MQWYLLCHRDREQETSHPGVTHIPCTEWSKDCCNWQASMLSPEQIKLDSLLPRASLTTGRYWRTGRSPDVVSAFAALEKFNEPSPETTAAREKIVFQLYEPGTSTSDVCDLRWRLFTKKQSEGQKLPPTRGALKEYIACAHYQAMVWFQDDVLDPQLPPLTDYG